MMNSLIIDDEPSARARLKRMLSDHASVVSVKGEAGDGLAALGMISERQPDLIFLDIEMPGLNGFQMLQSLPEEISHPLVIFVTGYDQHALAAFEANALAYLLKPVEAERLAQVIDRANRIHSFAAQRSAEHQGVKSMLQGSTGQLRQVVGRKLDKYFLLALEEIHFFRVDDGIVRAHTGSDRYWVSYQLNQLEAALPDDQFFRVHRSAIVNLTKVSVVRPWSKSSFVLTMNDAARTEIQVSERQATLLRRRFPGL